MMTRAERVIAFIEKYCCVPEGSHVGELFRLEPFQKKFILDVYDNPIGTRRAYLSIARKNGKTGLIGCLLLAHLVGPEAKKNSQIISGAMSREQASIVYHYAEKIVSLSPNLAQLVRCIPSQKRLVGLPMNTEYKAIAAEGKTAQGLSPVLAILDEIGQVSGPNSAFVDAIETSQGAHDAPLLLAISTQAASDSDMFSIWLDDAEMSEDPAIVSHVYKADEDCELLDQDQWRKANPALGSFRNERDLEEQLKQACRMPSRENSARNLLLNQRVSTNSPLVSANVWKGCGDKVLDFGNAELYGGLDLSSRLDLTSLVLIGKVDFVWQVEVHCWMPKRGLADRVKRDKAPYDLWARQGHIHLVPGASVDYEYVAKDIAQIVEGRNLQRLAFDRWRMDLMKKEFDEIGCALPLVPFGQGYKSMSPAIDSLEACLLNQTLAHGMNPVLTMCAQNVVAIKDPAGNRKLDKMRSTGRIDAFVALTMAMGATGMPAEDAQEKEYQMLALG